MRVAILAVLMVLAFAAPALAEHSIAHDEQTRQRLTERFLPPGEGDALGNIVAYDPIYSQWHLTGLHELGALCNNFDGYWYQSVDGDWYWHDC